MTILFYKAIPLTWEKSGIILGKRNYKQSKIWGEPVRAEQLIPTLGSYAGEQKILYPGNPQQSHHYTQRVANKKQKNTTVVDHTFRFYTHPQH